MVIGHLALARTLRQSMTDAERKLWRQLRGRRMARYKFRRQVPLGPYIADFVCQHPKVVVELDGSQHARTREQDAERDALLAKMGYLVVRISNADFLRDEDAVLRTILGTLLRTAEELLTSPPEGEVAP